MFNPHSEILCINIILIHFSTLVYKMRYWVPQHAMSRIFASCLESYPITTFPPPTGKSVKLKKNTVKKENHFKYLLYLVILLKKSETRLTTSPITRIPLGVVKNAPGGWNTMWWFIFCRLRKLWRPTPIWLKRRYWNKEKKSYK